MKTNQILIRYGELSTKGRNRKAFISRLRNNIQTLFSDVPTLRIKAERDRMFLFCDDEQGMENI